MSDNVCPWWMGYLLLNPIRRLIQNPDDILKNYVGPKMMVVDIGCAMGYFSLPMAKLVGEQGKVVCIDMQDKMLEILYKRARKAGLDGCIETRKCSQNALLIDDLRETVDFVLAFAVVHEVPDKGRLFREINMALKKGGSLLVAEPTGHVSAEDFNTSISIAEKSGFSISKQLDIGKSRSVLLLKNKG
ncbi:MAG: class I SAM-dependent methyltransferase [Bacillota bacterium]